MKKLTNRELRKRILSLHDTKPWYIVAKACDRCGIEIKIFRSWGKAQWHIDDYLFSKPKECRGHGTSLYKASAVEKQQSKKHKLEFIKTIS
jgi:hypothetical protein